MSNDATKNLGELGLLTTVSAGVVSIAGLATPFTQSGTGAVARTTQDKLRESVSVLDFGADPTGSVDSTAAIQAAINVTSAAGQRLYFPAGTYILTLSQSIILEGGTTVCSLKAKTGMKLQGSGMSATVLKLKDNQSTDASPKYFNIIASNEVLDGVIIDGIGFDINGQNNKISPNRGTSVYNRYNCAALIISGSTPTVGVDARISNSKITNCMFKNSPGVTCIGLAQSNQVGTVLGNNVEICGNIFYNNGLDTDDHSSIYMWGESINVHDNLFYHPTMSSSKAGPYCAAELHGARNFFVNNDVYNYYQGLWIAGNMTNLGHEQTIVGNSFVVAHSAMGTFIESATEPGVKNVTITGNDIWLTGDFASVGVTKPAIEIVASYGKVDGVICSDNNIFTTDVYSAYAISLRAISTGTKVRNVIITNNNIRGFAVGIVPAGQLENVSITDNVIADLTPNTTSPTYTIGVSLSGVNTGALSICRNEVSSVSYSPYFGIYLLGTHSNLHMDGNVAPNAQIPISDGATVSGRRTGRDATLFSSLPAQSTWVIGDTATNASLNQSGISPNKYIVTGWSRVTSGTGNVLNTDWWERRVFTGN